MDDRPQLVPVDAIADGSPAVHFPLVHFASAPIMARFIMERVFGSMTSSDQPKPQHQPVLDYRDLARADKALQARFNGVLRDRGILKSPAKIYPHLALTEDDLQQTETAITAAAAAVAA